GVGDRDSTATLQRALDAAGEGGVVSVPAGVHLTGPLHIPRSVKLTGVPRTVLKLKQGIVNERMGTALVTLESDAALEGMTLDGNTAENATSLSPSFGTALVAFAPGSQFARVTACTLR